MGNRTMKNRVMEFCLVWLIISVWVFGVLEKDLTVGGQPTRILYVDEAGAYGYDSIQDAINAANPGDTIFVFNGTYGGFKVFKSVNLIGEGKEVTGITGYNNGIKITAWGVTIQGFTIFRTGSSSWEENYNVQDSAIILINAQYCKIMDNNISNNYGSGVFLTEGSENNVIINNNISSNGGFGIIFKDSSQNTVKNNIVSNNNYDQENPHSGNDRHEYQY